MYISSLGSSFAFTSTGKVLESFSPNSRPFFSASSLSLWNIGTASLYWRSSPEVPVVKGNAVIAHGVEPRACELIAQYGGIALYEGIEVLFGS